MPPSFASLSFAQQQHSDSGAASVESSTYKYIRLISSSDMEFFVPLDRLIQASGFFRRLYATGLSTQADSKFTEVRESAFKFPFIHSECLESVCQYIMRPACQSSERPASQDCFSIRPDLAMELLLVSDVLDL